jgi:hypothetical protein
MFESSHHNSQKIYRNYTVRGDGASYGCYLAQNAVTRGGYCCLRDRSHLLLVPALKYEFEVSFRMQNFSYNGVRLPNTYDVCPQIPTASLQPFTYIAIYFRCGDFLNIGIPKLHAVDALLAGILSFNESKQPVLLIGNSHTHGLHGDGTCPVLFDIMGDYIEKKYNVTVYSLGDHELFADIHCLLHSRHLLVFTTGGSTFGRFLSIMHSGCGVYVLAKNTTHLPFVSDNYHYVDISDTGKMKPLSVYGTNKQGFIEEWGKT